VSTEAPPSQPSEQSAQALERYAAKIRRARLRYFAAIAVVVVAASVLATVIWLSGEISHTTLRTSAMPHNVPLGTTSKVLTKAWSSTDTAAIGTPYDNGTVVTHDRHTVRGRDGRTGAQTWSYTRTDRVVCAAAQSNGTTVAVFMLNGNCDEVTGLDSGTGKRKWDRTLDLDTHQVNGVAAIDIVADTITFTTPSVIYAIDLNSGYNDWLYSQPTCTISHSVLGSAGDLISQTCTHRDCSNVDAKFCANGSQLLLRNGSTGENTDSSKNKGNPDQVIWTRKGVDLVPVSASALITALNPDATTLTVLDAAAGKTLHTVALGAAQPSQTVAALRHADAFDAELLWLGGISYALPTPGVAFSWTAATTTLPSLTASSGTPSASLTGALLTVPSATGISSLDPRTGKLAASYAVTASGTPAVYPYGTGFLVAGTTTTVYR
jgi:hypothetical protein